MGTTISNAQWLNLGVNTLLPILVALITDRLASGSVKAGLLLILSAVSGFGIAWLDAVNHGVGFDFSQAGFTAVTGLIVAGAAHFTVWKPVGITGSEGRASALLVGADRTGGRPATGLDD